MDLSCLISCKGTNLKREGKITHGALNLKSVCESLRLFGSLVLLKGWL